MGHTIANEEIMEQVTLREADIARIKRCLAVNICPKCGGDLDHNGLGYQCTACDFVAKYT